jgi:hypothetical protein
MDPEGGVTLLNDTASNNRAGTEDPHASVPPLPCHLTGLHQSKTSLEASPMHLPHPSQTL